MKWLVRLLFPTITNVRREIARDNAKLARTLDRVLREYRRTP